MPARRRATDLALGLVGSVKSGRSDLATKKTLLELAVRTDAMRGSKRRRLQRPDRGHVRFGCGGPPMGNDADAPAAADYGYVLENVEIALERPSLELFANPRGVETYLGPKTGPAA